MTLQVDMNRPTAVKARPKTLRLTAKAIKVMIVVDPKSIEGLEVPAGIAQAPFVVTVESGCSVCGALNPRTLRRAVTTIAQAGADRVAVTIQGKLAIGDRLAEAGITAQLKSLKP